MAKGTPLNIVGEGARPGWRFLDVVARQARRPAYCDVCSRRIESGELHGSCMYLHVCLDHCEPR